MKKAIRIFSTLLLAVFAVAGCMKPDSGEQESGIDVNLLYGTWNCSAIGLSYDFNRDYTGRYYDENGDGKSFTWSLDGNILQIKASGEGIHVIAFETYIITSLTAGTMKCYDEQDISKEILIFRK